MEDRYRRCLVVRREREAQLLANVSDGCDLATGVSVGSPLGGPAIEYPDGTLVTTG